MKGLVLALQFLTRLPTPRLASTPAEFAASMRWFPAAGLVVGLAVAGAGWLGALRDDWIGALAALAAWVLVTGGLHLDGLGDLADAGGAAHKDRERLLAVLADPHVGSFAVVAIGLQLLAKLVLLHTAIGDGAWAALALVPFAARIGPLAWTLWLPQLHAGLASSFGKAVRRLHLLLWGCVLLAAAWGAPAILAAFGLIPLWAWHLRRAVGGISGDGHGAGIELVETGLLIAVVAAGQGFA